MEQFGQLPFPQKLAVLVVAMAAVAGLFYYAMIMPLEEQRQNNETQRGLVQKEIDALKAELAKAKVTDRKAEKERLQTEEKRFENMLPRAQELERFITGLSDTAKNAGLTLTSFEKDKPLEHDYYVEFPIKMEVMGTYREFVGFLRAVAAKDQRIVNIRDLTITRTELNPTPILVRYEEERRNELPQGFNLPPLSPLQQLMQLVKATEELIAGGVPLRAGFTAVVFTYTGKPASPGAAKKAETRMSERKERRKRRILAM